MEARLRASSEGFTATEVIVRVFAAIVRSTSPLMANSLKKRGDFDKKIKKDREGFQILLAVAAIAANENPRSRSATPVRQQAGSVIPSIEDRSESQSRMIIPNVRVTQKAQEYLNDQRRPNLHTTFHYEATMMEYDMPSNINVLIGEDKHR